MINAFFGNRTNDEVHKNDDNIIEKKNIEHSRIENNA